MAEQGRSASVYGLTVTSAEEAVSSRKRKTVFTLHVTCRKSNQLFSIRNTVAQQSMEWSLESVAQI